MIYCFSHFNLVFDNQSMAANSKQLHYVGMDLNVEQLRPLLLWFMIWFLTFVSLILFFFFSFLDKWLFWAVKCPKEEYSRWKSKLLPLTFWMLILFFRDRGWWLRRAYDVYIRFVTTNPEIYWKDQSSKTIYNVKLYDCKIFDGKYIKMVIN